MGRFNRLRHLTHLIVVLSASSALAAGCMRRTPIPSGYYDNTPPAAKDPSDGEDVDAGPPEDTEEAPEPTVTALTPSSATIGTLGPTIAVKGEDFVRRSQIEVDGEKLPTFFVSESELRTTLPSSVLEGAGKKQITVFSSKPGGGRSNRAAFTVTYGQPTLSFLSPTSAMAGAADTSVMLNGSGFFKDSKVMLGSEALATRFVDGTAVVATIPAAKLAASGTLLLSVKNPEPGGTASAAIAFTVASQDLVLSQITPSSTTVGATTLTVKATGSGFDAKTKLLLNGNELSTKFVSTTELGADLPASLLATAQDVPINARSASGTLSTPVTFRILNPSPTITSVTPQTVPIGSPPTAITVKGTGFVQRSEIQFDGVASPTTYVSPTELRATASERSFAAAGTLGVRVTNPTPGGGPSTLSSVAVAGNARCDSQGVDVVLTTPQVVSVVDITQYTLLPLARPELAPQDTASYTCPLVRMSTNKQWAYARVVQNNTDRTLTLGAYASCKSTESGVLMMYKTGDVPGTDPARLQCTGFVSMGAEGGGGRTSPDANGSRKCPGLTLANGGGIELLPCERAVVLLQAFNHPTEKPPFKLNLRLDP